MLCIDHASLDPRDVVPDPDAVKPEMSLLTDSRFDQGDAIIVRDMVFGLQEG